MITNDIDEEDRDFELKIRSLVSETTEEQFSSNDELVWESVYKSITKPKKSKFTIIHFGYYAAAAIVIICLTVVIWFSKFNNSETPIAINTNSNQQKLVIEKPKNNNIATTIDSNNSVNVKSSTESSVGEIQQFSSDLTVKEVKLSDGSTIWLNAHSSITFNYLKDKHRNVSLMGEGYFEIKPDSKCPFEVSFNDNIVKVIGTKFIIRNIQSEDFNEISVTEGQVAVVPNNEQKTYQLFANDHLVINKNNKNTVESIDATIFLFGANKNMKFKNTPLKHVFTILSRNFQSEFILDQNCEKCTFSGNLTGLNLNEALKIIQLTSNVQIETKEKVIYIKGNNCE